MNEKCRNCKYSYYDPPHGYVCLNSDSEYIADYIDGEDWCDEFAEKE